MQAFRAGHSITEACEMAGITTETFRGWRHKGEKEKASIYGILLQATQRVTRIKTLETFIANNIYQNSIEETTQRGRQVTTHPVITSDLRHIVEELIVLLEESGEEWQAHPLLFRLISKLG